MKLINIETITIQKIPRGFRVYTGYKAKDILSVDKGRTN